MKLQTTLSIGALLVIPLVFILAITWKLSQSDVEGDSQEVASPDPGEKASAPQPSEEEETPEQNSKSQVHDAPPMDRMQAKRLIDDCEGGQFSACDELESQCMRVIPEAPQKRIKDIPGVRTWNRVMPTKGHHVQSVEAGCRPYFHGMACLAGSDNHCLSAGTQVSLSKGCKRGCEQCCDAAERAAEPGSDVALGRDCDGADPDACVRLAERLRRASGDGPQRARARVQKACLITPHACDQYARYVGLGWGGERDEEEALRLLERARRAPDPQPGCEPSSSVACRGVRGLAYLETLSTIAPSRVAERCQKGDLLACTAKMLPAPDDYDRTLEKMNEAAAKVYPPCPSVMGRCEAARVGCREGNVAACLSIVGRPASSTVEELRLAFDQLAKSCAAGKPYACIE